MLEPVVDDVRQCAGQRPASPECGRTGADRVRDVVSHVGVFVAQGLQQARQIERNDGLRGASITKKRQRLANHGVDALHIPEDASSIDGRRVLFDPQPDTREGHAQVVADGGEHASPLVDQLSNAQAHLVQGFGQLADLCRAARRQRVVVVRRVAERARCVGHGGQRLDDPPDCIDRQGENRDEDDRQRDGDLERREDLQGLEFGLLESDARGAGDIDHDRTLPAGHVVCGERVQVPGLAQGCRDSLREQVRRRGLVARIRSRPLADVRAGRLRAGDPVGERRGRVETSCLFHQRRNAGGLRGGLDFGIHAHPRRTGDARQHHRGQHDTSQHRGHDEQDDLPGDRSRKESLGRLHHSTSGRAVNM